MIDNRALVIFKDASELVGIDKSKNELISLLAENESSSQHQLKVVSFVGCGGLGKTTIAKQVYESLKHKFQCHAFVTVLRNPNMVEVLRTILRDVNKQEYAGDIQHLIETISNFLENKRYFIVVDDLWDSESWETIKCAFIKSSYGSRIITTTRINDVAKSCSSSHQGHIYKLRPLNDEDSRGLLLKRIFGTREGCPSHLAQVSNDILKKCGGLPLAVISIAGLLAGKAPTFEEWNKVQSSFGYALERQSDINKMIQILLLSYFDLPPHLRSCLLCLSVFPEDHIIEKDRLIMRWIAEGFIHEQHGFTQYELGERCLNELVNRSLIQPCHSDYWRTPFSYRVHDTILEFIVSRAVEENFVTLFGVPNPTCDPQRKIRRLSFQNKNEVCDDVVGLQEKMIYSHARAVSVFTRSLGSLPSLQKFRRVLDLKGCKGLQDHHLTDLDGLFALRYLGLRKTQIKELPKKIGELQYLQTIDVRDTAIKELPSGRFAWLVNILCNGVRLPDGFGNMQALQMLETIKLSCQPPSFAHELRQLRNLRRLTIQTDEFTKDLWSSLSILGSRSLNSLIISLINKESIINLLMEPWSSTPLSLKLFEIWRVQFPRVPRWIGSLNNLQHLAIDVKQIGPEDVGLLGRLGALSYLNHGAWLEVADRSSSSEEAQRIKISGAQGFPSLRISQFGSPACGLGLFFEAGAMPRLQMLILEFDPEETGSFTDEKFDFGIQYLPCLETVRYESDVREDWRPEDDPVMWDALKRAVSSHPNHPTLSYD